MSTMRIFVSHSHEDDAFCRALVDDLRTAGADVWYDEHNLGSGQLMTVIQRELGSRPVFVVILTRATFASRWVRRETLWAYELADRDPTRILLPVSAGPMARSNFSAENEWLVLHDFKRIQPPGYQPCPEAGAVTRPRHALQLTLPGEAPLSTGPLPADSLADLIGRGRALNAQGKYAEALPLFQRALERDPRSVDAWLTAGYTLGNMGRYAEALVALDRALALNPNSARAWSNKGAALNGRRRDEEELAAYDRALALDPQYAKAWSNKGYALLNLKRYPEALAAYDRSLALDPNEADAWSNKGLALLSLNRPREALVAFDRALDVDPDLALTWYHKGRALRELERAEEEVAAYDEALALDPNEARVWRGKGTALWGLKRHREALAAYDRALEIDPNDGEAWSSKGAVLNELQHYKEALVAYDRALALDQVEAFAWSDKGLALLSLKRYPEALAAYDRALEIDPNKADAWSDKGLALLSLKRYSEALVVFDRALALDPDDAVAVSGKGNVFHERSRNGRKATQIRERTATGRLDLLRFRLRQHPLHLIANLFLTLMLVGLLGILVYIGLQRIGQLTPTTTPHATPVPKHEPTPEVAAGFTGFENASFSLAYPTDWTHTHHDDALNARNILHSEDYKGAGNNEVLVGITASVPGDQLQAFLSDVAHHQFSQWTLQGLGPTRHITYDHEQWLEDDYAVAVLQGQSYVTLGWHVLVANPGTLNFFLYL